MKKSEQVERLDWETENQFNYRVETGRIIFSIGEILSSISKIKYQKENVINLYDELKKLKNKLIKLIVPEIYTKVHEYLVNCLKSYIKGSCFLKDGVNLKDSTLTYKAGRYIKEGNAWMEIAKTRIWEEIEKIMNTVKEEKKGCTKNE